MKNSSTLTVTPPPLQPFFLFIINISLEPVLRRLRLVVTLQKNYFYKKRYSGHAENFDILCDKKYTLFKREGGWPPFLPGRGHVSYSTPFIILLFIEKREGRGGGE